MLFTADCNLQKKQTRRQKQISLNFQNDSSKELDSKYTLIAYLVVFLKTLRPTFRPSVLATCLIDHVHKYS